MATTTRATVHDALYIGSEWVAPADPRGTISVINPATEEVIGSIPEGTPEDVNQAVAAARTAFETWSQTSVAERVQWLERIAATLAERQLEIATVVSQEVGMPIRQAVAIQAGLPTMTFTAMPQLVAQVQWEQEIG